MTRKGSIQGFHIAPCLLAIIIDNLGFGLVYPLFASLFTTDLSLLPAHDPDTIHFYLGLGYLLYRSKKSGQIYTNA